MSKTIPPMMTGPVAGWTERHWVLDRDAVPRLSVSVVRRCLAKTSMRCIGRTAMMACNEFNCMKWCDQVQAV